MIEFIKKLWRMLTTRKSKVDKVFEKITLDPEFLKLQRMMRRTDMNRNNKAVKNSKKKYATTKGFNKL